MAPKKKKPSRDTLRKSSNPSSVNKKPAKTVTEVAEKVIVDVHAKPNGQPNDLAKIPSYPGRLMVDFTCLDLPALRRYLEFYQIVLRDGLTKDQMAAVVAKHFDGTLDVDEDDSICSFVRRIRNGKKVPRNNALKKEKKEKKRKKNSSRKRQREEVVQEEEAPEEEMELYCICNKPSYGDMIACDGEKCKTPSQWYHLGCVGLKPGAHPETWHCPECENMSD